MIATEEKCGRCGRVMSSWEDEWPNYGYIKLGVSSQMHGKLNGDIGCASDEAFTKWENYKLGIVALQNKTPFKNIEAQGVVLMWGQGVEYDTRGSYVLCRQCQAELISIIGKFFKF